MQKEFELSKKYSRRKIKKSNNDFIIEMKPQVKSRDVINMIGSPPVPKLNNNNKRLSKSMSFAIGATAERIQEMENNLGINKSPDHSDGGSIGVPDDLESANTSTT